MSHQIKNFFYFLGKYHTLLDYLYKATLIYKAIMIFTLYLLLILTLLLVINKKISQFLLKYTLNSITIYRFIISVVIIFFIHFWLTIH